MSYNFRERPRWHERLKNWKSGEEVLQDLKEQLDKERDMFFENNPVWGTAGDKNRRETEKEFPMDDFPRRHFNARQHFDDIASRYPMFATMRPSEWDGDMMDSGSPRMGARLGPQGWRRSSDSWDSTARERKPSGGSDDSGLGSASVSGRSEAGSSAHDPFEGRDSIPIKVIHERTSAATEPQNFSPRTGAAFPEPTAREFSPRSEPISTRSEPISTRSEPISTRSEPIGPRSSEPPLHEYGPHISQTRKAPQYVQRFTSDIPPPPEDAAPMRNQRAASAPPAEGREPSRPRFVSKLTINPQQNTQETDTSRQSAAKPPPSPGSPRSSGQQKPSFPAPDSPRERQVPIVFERPLQRRCTPPDGYYPPTQPPQPTIELPPPPQQPIELPPPLPHPEPPPQEEEPVVVVPPQVDSDLAMIRSVQDDVDDLKVRIENFRGKKGEKDYLYLDEMLMRNLLKLDNIETQGKDDVKSERKNTVKRIQRCFSILEEKAGGKKPNVEKSNDGNVEEEKNDGEDPQTSENSGDTKVVPDDVKLKDETPSMGESGQEVQAEQVEENQAELVT